MTSIHPLEYNQWVLYVLQEESKSKQQKDTVYREFFQYYPLASHMWTRYASKASTVEETLEIYQKAILVNKYCPSLWYAYLSYILTCNYNGDEVETTPLFAQAIQYVGSHPASFDLWRLVLDTDLVNEEILTNLFSSPLPFLSTLWERLQKRKQIPIGRERDLDILKTSAEARWDEKKQYEKTLSTDEYGGKPATQFGMRFLLHSLGWYEFFQAICNCII